MDETDRPESDGGALVARPGARFRCFGDGLCCTDLHALGPLSADEARDLRDLLPGSLEWNDEFEGECLRVDAGGVCQQLAANGLCGIEVRFGPEHKPIGCRRFPYGLVETPLGRRVTTEHRCPCRSLGGQTRPPLALADAELSLRDRSGHLESDGAAPDVVPLTREVAVDFDRYAEFESVLLRRLADGEQAEAVLDAEPFPPLAMLDWTGCGRDFVAMQDGTAGGVALAWFGEALVASTTGATPALYERPWRAAFERALARSPVADDPERIVNDWLGDELWMLRWLDWEGCSFAVARAELATRLAGVRIVMHRLGQLGLRADQIAAEAVMIAGLAGCTTRWPEQVADIVEPGA